MPLELNRGYIICRCKLVDCVYISKEYITKLKNENYEEYLCGDYRKGRYAWLLEEVVPLKNKIYAKGQLGIWNYYNEQEVLNLMKDIQYGWVDKNKQKHEKFTLAFRDLYQLQTPQELIKNKMGICWDQVELERYYLKNNYWDTKSYFIIYYDPNKYPMFNHTFLVFKKDNKYYWFENSLKEFKGVFEYQSLKDLLVDVTKKFGKVFLEADYQKENIIIKEYQKPKKHLTSPEFYEYCLKSKTVVL